MTGPAWIERLERRLGWAAVPGLASFLIGMNAAVWALALLKPEFPELLALDPTLVARGQLWRLATFLFIPPPLSPFWMFFWLYLLFMYARTLETEWGDFRFNLFYGIGAAATIAASLTLGRQLSNVALNASLFLAFAAIYPDFELLLLFVLPVKVKWLAALAWMGIGWGLLAGDWDRRAATLAGVANYLVFFGPGHWERGRQAWRSWRFKRRMGG